MSGKFGNDAYKVSGGLHGVGASVVNALSKTLIAIVKRDNKIYESRYGDGGKILQPAKVVGTTKTTGTKIIFKPDDSIFPVCKFNESMILERLREASFLFQNLEIKFIDKNHNEHIFNNKEGVAGFVKFINESKSEISPICVMVGNEENIDCQIAFQYCDDYNDTIISFANSVKTKEGGSHEAGFKLALTECLNFCAKKNKWFTKANQVLDVTDLTDGITAVISVYINESILLYEGQTKAKLFTQEAKSAVYKIVIQQLTTWLNNNLTTAKKIIKKALDSQDARLAAKKYREEAKKIKNVKSARLLAGKLTPPQTRNPAKNEIFLVEGDSAGGSAKTCRSKAFQAILPLKGKIINVEKKRLSELLDNTEIASIINALGVGFGKDLNLKNLNFHKIIIMTDADNDGAHIAALLLTLIYRYMKPLIENNYVYLANPPLYQVHVKGSKTKKSFFAWNEYELNKLKEQYKELEIRRFKGLGEMQAEQLWETTMNPETRQLIAVTLNDVAMAERRISTLMGNDVELRKTWIDENINFVSEGE